MDSPQLDESGDGRKNESEEFVVQQLVDCVGWHKLFLDECCSKEGACRVSTRGSKVRLASRFFLVFHKLTVAIVLDQMFAQIVRVLVDSELPKFC